MGMNHHYKTSANPRSSQLRTSLLALTISRDRGIYIYTLMSSDETTSKRSIPKFAESKTRKLELPNKYPSVSPPITTRPPRLLHNKKVAASQLIKKLS